MDGQGSLGRRGKLDLIGTVRAPSDGPRIHSQTRATHGGAAPWSRRRVTGVHSRWLPRVSPNPTTGAKWCARQSEAIPGLTRDGGEVRGADPGPRRTGADLPQQRQIRGLAVVDSARRA
jgi:hypothetical protein